MFLSLCPTDKVSGYGSPHGFVEEVVTSSWSAKLCVGGTSTTI